MTGLQHVAVAFYALAGLVVLAGTLGGQMPGTLAALAGVAYAVPIGAYGLLQWLDGGWA